MSQPLRVGVVGVGYLGRFHALIYSRLSSVELVGVVDSDAQRAADVASEAGCSAFDSVDALCDAGVGAVSVVVPTTAHLDVTLPLIERGVHVLLEKPIATTVAEGERLVAAAERAGVVFQIGHLERFNAGVLALADRITTPRYIEAQRMGGFVERATDVDVVSDLMIHDIDIILSLVPSELATVSAVGTPVLTEHADIASARLEFANGTVANVVASRVSDAKARRIRVFQPGMYLSLDFIGQTLDMAEPKLVEGAARPEIGRERLEIEPVKPLDREIESFVHCVGTGERPLVDGRVGLKALDVALQVHARIDV